MEGQGCTQTSWAGDVEMVVERPVVKRYTQSGYTTSPNWYVVMYMKCSGILHIFVCQVRTTGQCAALKLCRLKGVS